MVRSKLLVTLAVGVAVLSACTVTTRATGPMMGGATSRHAVSRACAVPAALAGDVVTVHLADMSGGMMMSGRGGMMMRVAPSVVGAGRVTLVAYNMGTRTHELVVLPLAAGQQAGERTVGADGKVDESGSLGEASTTCGAGAGEGIAAGSASWVTLTLTPGRYELVCNLKNHYASGMYAELVVTG